LKENKITKFSHYRLVQFKQSLSLHLSPEQINVIDCSMADTNAAELGRAADTGHHLI